MQNFKHRISAQISKIFSQMLFTLSKLREAVSFIYEHKLWDGFWRYGWFGRILVALGVILGFRFIFVYLNWFQHADASNLQSMMFSVGNLFQNVFWEGYSFLFNGWSKYALLILLEVIVFHFCRRAYEIRSGEKSESDFDAFVKAQFRMIWVALRSWILEIVFIAIAGAFFGVFGFLAFLKPIVEFGIKSYYVGFAMVDNYNEQFELTITQSAKYARNYIGVALGLGMVLNLLFYFPVVGSILGPILGGVAVTLVMYEISDVHILGEKVVEPELEDA